MRLAKPWERLRQDFCRVALGGVTAFAAALVGCAHPLTPAERMRDDLMTMKSEHSIDKLVERGRAFASVGDLTRAEQYLSAGMEVGGDPATILPELLRVCVEANRFRVAITYATPWLAMHPRDRKLRFVVAALRAGIGDASGASADLEQLVTEAPGDSHAHFAYAVLLRDQVGDPVRADRQFRAYLGIEPEGTHADEARASLLETVP